VSILKSLTLKDMVLFIKAGLKACRFFSLGIAFGACGLGVLLALADGFWDLWNAVLVMAAGLILQTGVNLVNDFNEYKQGELDDKIPHYKIAGQTRDFLEWLIFLAGLGCLALTACIGLYFVFRLRGWPLFALGLAGMAGAFFYTAEPFNYKRRGLGVVLVFFLMGTLMTSGTYFILTGGLTVRAVLVSVPLSLVVSLVLLGNEIRDYESDLRHGIYTLTARLGLRPAAVVYYGLFVLANAIPVVLFSFGIYRYFYFVYLALPLFWPLRKMPFLEASGRKNIIRQLILYHGSFVILTLASVAADIILWA
jgi:1,4-dihydroxy-2-naphthoate octaprenyltransferase